MNMRLNEEKVCECLLESEEFDDVEFIICAIENGEILVDMPMREVHLTKSCHVF
jgi:hypothetical protein